jgi:hypothetical protein
MSPFREVIRDTFLTGVLIVIWGAFIIGVAMLFHK